jgi:hypothetical protein
MNSDKHSEKGYVDGAVLANKIESLEAEPSALALVLAG